MVNDMFLCVMFISSNILICSPHLKISVEEGSGKPGLEQLSLEVARCQIQDMYPYVYVYIYAHGDSR